MEGADSVSGEGEGMTIYICYNASEKITLLCVRLDHSNVIFSCKRMLRIVSVLTKTKT